MKKLICLFLSLCLLLTGCGGGDASQVQLITGESALFTEREIEAAMEVAMNYFRKEFDGCTMTKIEYIESQKTTVSKTLIVFDEGTQKNREIAMYESYEESGPVSVRNRYEITYNYTDETYCTGTATTLALDGTTTVKEFEEHCLSKDELGNYYCIYCKNPIEK